MKRLSGAARVVALSLAGLTGAFFLFRLVRALPFPAVAPHSVVKPRARVLAREGSFRLLVTRNEGSKGGMEVLLEGETEEPVQLEVTGGGAGRCVSLASWPRLERQARFCFRPEDLREYPAGAYFVRAKTPSGFFDQELVRLP